MTVNKRPSVSPPGLCASSRRCVQLASGTTEAADGTDFGFGCQPLTEIHHRILRLCEPKGKITELPALIATVISAPRAYNVEPLC